MLNDEQLKIFANKGFDDAQLGVIRSGIKQNLAIEEFAKLENDAMKMNTMKLAMLNNIDLEPYINMDFNSSQLYEIFLGKLSKVDVSLYAKPDINSNHMSTLRELLEMGMDISKITAEDLEIKYYSYPKSLHNKIDEYKEQEHKRMQELGLL